MPLMGNKKHNSRFNLPNNKDAVEIITQKCVLLV
jgi:hypothetical protein